MSLTLCHIFCFIKHNVEFMPFLLSLFLTLCAIMWFLYGFFDKDDFIMEYFELLQEFMTAVKQNYGEKVLIEFEDFANHNAFELLAKYGTTHLVQGVASVVLVGVVAGLKLINGNLADHTFLFLGAGKAGTGIVELIALEMSKRTKTPIEETHKNIWLVDSKVVEKNHDGLSIQANNAYIFPGFGLGLVILATITVHDDM